MKNAWLLILVLLFCCASAQAETLAEWDFFGVVFLKGQGPVAADSQDASLTGASLSHSTVASDVKGATSAYKAVNWEEATDMASSITRGQYFTINFETVSGTALDLTSIEIMLKESVSAGETIGYGITSDVLGHTVSDALTTGTLSNDEEVYLDLDLSGGTYDNLISIEFRIYGWDAASGMSNGDGLFIGDAFSGADDGVADIKLSGTLSSSAQLGTLFTIK